MYSGLVLEAHSAGSTGVCALPGNWPRLEACVCNALCPFKLKECSQVGDARLGLAGCPIYFLFSHMLLVTRGSARCDTGDMAFPPRVACQRCQLQCAVPVAVRGGTEHAP